MRWRVALAIGGVLALAGCYPAQQQPIAQGAAYVSEAVLTPAQLSIVRLGCQVSGPALARWSTSSNAVLADTAIDGAAYCQQLAAAPAGSVPGTTTPATATWLTALIAAAQLAAMVV